MDINKSCKLVLKDVFLYDISSCHYVTLEKLGFDLSKIDKNDKKKRNIQIGLMMKENPRITSVLKTVTNSTIDEYLTRNNVKKEELILRAYDGIITTKKLKIIDRYIPIDEREYYECMIISSDRQKYVARRYEELTIKGVSYLYSEMEKIFKRLTKIEFAKKETIFTTLQKIKDEIEYGENLLLYCIPLKDDKYLVFLKGYGEIQISESMIKILDINDIDKEKYFELYLRTFCESIVLEYA